ncbi:hypothetical protein AMJ49_02415 [Parcubacteria bacterium DG_74_2]|nr:MAG: hypothetical protein AMJ49_02415 [Parcubacteria bacterium DG_74_2]
MVNKNYSNKGKPNDKVLDSVIKTASKEINIYLDQKYTQGEIREELYRDAKKNVIPNIIKWLEDENIARISPNFRFGIKKAIEAKRWEDLIYAFLDKIAFGTAGIRGIATFTEEELRKLALEGINTKILKGPNTINEIVFLLVSAGVANYAAKKNLTSIVIGYDSRIKGEVFAQLIAKIFLAKELKVYLFDEASPYPEVNFAVPFLKADLGITISASHNDKRYNGYKISSNTGAGLSIWERNYIYNNFIKNISTDELKLRRFKESEKEKLVFLGGAKPLEGEDYYGRKLIDIHKYHREHIKKFIMDKKMLERWARRVNVGYSAYHGSGRKTVPQLLKELGLSNLKIIHSLDELNGMFPCFLLKQQPDPGDPLAAQIAVDEFKKEYGNKAFKELDILIGTDPDADRVGLIVKIPPEQQRAYKEIIKTSEYVKIPGSKKRSDYSWILLESDIIWPILLWYRLEKEKEQNEGRIPDLDKKFIVLNHLTTDTIVKLAQKYGLGVIKTWVGFAIISDAIERVWRGEKLSNEAYPELVFETFGMTKKRSINIGAMEQSSGFSILGSPPLVGERLGENGHIRDKDGTFAAILLAELAAYTKSEGKTIMELVDEKLYLDPDIGCFITYFESLPYWGQYEGPTGMSKKINILKNADDVREKIKKGEKVSLAGLKVISTEVYKTGKYDEIHRWKGFPDEGIRFYFDKERNNHFTIRPSGTSHCLRIHVQLKAENVNKDNLLRKKIETLKKAMVVVKEARKMFKEI